MPIYNPPLRDMKFVMYEFLGAEKIYQSLPKYKELDRNTLDQILEEAGKFCKEVIFPLNQIGDRQGCIRSEDGSVKTPDGFKEAYAKYVEAGWPSSACDTAYGGQDLPALLNTALYEMMNSSNQAWTMYPGLSHGAYQCLHEHGTEIQKKLYLEKLVSGIWTGTMCLTEPHCGTDLGLLKTKAEPLADGSFKITGTKIFISSGEHDLSSNIIHLVLARLPDSPVGSKGISLFAVPKFIPNEAGESGERNPVSCGSLEHKMGIHGNATCVMNFDGAVGSLVGEAHKGLNAMFIMMNEARLGVGLQSVGLTEVAYQNSVAYAKERVQGRSLTGPKEPNKPADSIIVHPDVRRMLLTQRAYAEGGRAFSYWVSMLIDIEKTTTDEKLKKENADLVALLTPIIKAFITDNAFTSTNEGLQVLGGHGFITEWGMEQFVRDARINMIYEGTNTIQSLDLLGRKVLGDMGAKLKIFGKYVRDFVEEEGTKKAMAEFVDPLADIGTKVEKLSMEIGMKAMMNKDVVGAAAVPYMRVLGHFVYAYLFARMARIALDHQKSDDPFYTAKLATARFYFARLLPEAEYHMKVIRSGADTLMALDASHF
ncbi:MAG: acyl-CoA dehydrogenase C-terminal domain-containing protein [Betaproteobacteria bacterium]